MLIKNKKILLAISGGPDSMLLLYKYIKKNIVVAHVNYNLRPESILEENLIRDYCQKFQIPFYILNLDESHKNNFQNWARKKRYHFFSEIYKKENCKKLLTAHHKDDFIESAIWQKNQKRNPYFWGIKKKQENYGMKIERPFIDKYFKNDIYFLNRKYGIDFFEDSSNSIPKYERNKIRITLQKWSKKEKENFIKKIMKENKNKKKIENKIKKSYFIWSNNNFSIDFLKNNEKIQSNLIFEFLIQNYPDIEITTNKINNILEFIFSKNEAKKIKLNNREFLYKNKKNIYNLKNEKAN
ncbi:MAG: tRNA lysidine(34) synthetase TilS [Metamycoplasmataceae bacterium]